MNFAVLLKGNDGEHALIKTNVFDRAYAVQKLCDLHLKTLRPDAYAFTSTNRKRNLQVGIHTDRDWIMARLLALEFPLPVGKDVLEGEYSVVE
jgi:hypothetical protein